MNCESMKGVDRITSMCDFYEYIENLVKKIRMRSSHCFLTEIRIECVQRMNEFSDHDSLDKSNDAPKKLLMLCIRV